MGQMTHAGAHDNGLSENLERETQQLRRAWAHHKPAFLNSYLVEGVEDPRINIQSILTRHFLLRSLVGDACDDIMAHEIRFALAANWLLNQLQAFASVYAANNQIKNVLDALIGGEGAQVADVPVFLRETFETLAFPNYLVDLLSFVPSLDSAEQIPDDCLNTFMHIWAEMLDGQPAEPISVIEPACGSANEYRFFVPSGLSAFLEYSGFDLCETNIANAHRAFPAIDFSVGNVFHIEKPDKACRLCYVHDLFEHLSPEGFERAIAEILRVTSHQVCLHFFNMADIEEHQIKPAEHYHWNRLSVDRFRERIEPQAQSIEIIHIDAFLKSQFSYPDFHNQGAYAWLITLK